MLFATYYHRWTIPSPIKTGVAPQSSSISSGLVYSELMATVYLDSSDDEATPLATTAKGKSTSYAPPRLTAAAKPSPGRFQFPASKLPTRALVPSGIRSASVSSNSGCPTPSPEDSLNTRGIPESDPVLILNSKGNVSKPTDSASSGPRKLESDKPPRSSLALERQMNELTGTVEEFRTANNEDLKEIQSTLAAIRATVDRLEAMVASANASASAASSSDTPPLLLPPIYALPPPSNIKPVMTNPPLTPDLSATISKVVQETRSRIGKKKGNSTPEENSIKDHTRKVFYRMLGISAAASVRGYFLNAHGQPDTLPAQFVDPDTLYCRPYPHWGVSMTQQMAWVPTYLAQFRAMVPKDHSELSKVLNGLSDEQVVILLHDGPFKTACTTFKSSQKTEPELAQLRCKARRYQRIERKVAVRSRYIKNMPALQSPDWTFLEHSGYMSADESDDEGVLVTKIPNSRSQWVTNTYRAIGVAEYLRTKGKYTPPSKTQIVNAPIPHLERGTGSAKMVLRIAECAISKSWRASHADEFAKSAHLVNASETTKPNVLDFLERHPLSLLNHDKNNITIKEEGDAVTGATERPPHEWEETPPIEYDGDEESAMILEVLEIGGPEAAGMGKGCTTSDIPIDPQLLGATEHGSGPSAGPSYHPESSPPPVGDILAGLDSEMNLSPPSSTPGMPPPPPLPAMMTGNSSELLLTSEHLAVNPNQTAGEVSLGAIPKKRRGRPPGSKNKKKQKTTETVEME
ncbi:hypothetical protein RhiLY_09224 [Ceratobasidium sp. AG-Ba]|nr:hypothetical protein RhiLY_00090 [Ceratobasidium sp. AG-Ba]QRW10225.1 hypothetical protein RhiLY_09224 [Ceratobasidium sp. AG-Ba]